MGRKVILFIAISLDGYIADKEGGVAWLGGQSKEYQGDYGYHEFIQGIDTVIMGMTTYHQLITELSPKEWVYPGMKCYVYTHQDQNNTEHVEFISGDVVEFMNKVKSQEGKDIYLCGGANLISQMIKKDIIDEYHLSIMPVILGAGIPLFTNENPTALLTLQKMKEINGVIDVIYSRRQI